MEGSRRLTADWWIFGWVKDFRHGETNGMKKSWVEEEKEQVVKTRSRRLPISTLKIGGIDLLRISEIAIIAKNHGSPWMEHKTIPSISSAGSRVAISEPAHNYVCKLHEHERTLHCSCLPCSL